MFGHVTSKSRFSSLERLCLASSVILVGSAIAMTVYMTNQYQDRFFPNTMVDGVDVSGKTKQEVREILLSRSEQAPEFSLTIGVDDIKVASTAAQLGGYFNYEDTIERAFAEEKKGSFLNHAWRIIQPDASSQTFTTPYQLDNELVRKQISLLASKVNIAEEQPSAVLKISGVPGSLKLTPGKSGRKVDEAETFQKISERIQQTDVHVPAVVASISAGLNPDQLDPALARAKKLVNKKITLRAENVFREMNDQLLINILAFPEGVSEKNLEPVISQLSKEVNRPPQNAEFEYDKESLKVTKFSPPRKGLALNTTQFKEDVASTIREFENDPNKASTELALAVQETEPDKTLAETNDLGIKERIGFGESQYAHSIPNRVINVALTASRINNTLVKPGEEFSFNKSLGEVSAKTGFKPAYVISGGKTVLGDGGGVCQVSTTLFRSLLNAGLPITKRKAHSYRVSYYELNSKPGIDATVYSGDVDLRFINDTGHYLLIHTQADSQKLYMTVEIYGTSDGRTAEISDHKVYDFRPAPPPLYVDDASIPKGQVKQIDFAASGVRASFHNIVKDKDGKLIRDDVYQSNYVPWQAVYLRGI
jgi:vancomycin resistance protein YoaR